jgi:hypothetical protein
VVSQTCCAHPRIHMTGISGGMGMDYKTIWRCPDCGQQQERPFDEKELKLPVNTVMR